MKYSKTWRALRAQFQSMIACSSLDPRQRAEAERRFRALARAIQTKDWQRMDVEVTRLLAFLMLKMDGAPAEDDEFEA